MWNVLTKITDRIMISLSIFKEEFMNLISTGSYLPPIILDNDQLASFVDTSSDWIIQRTGIHQRHVSLGETTAMLGAQAAQKALDASGLHKEDIDLIILATVTPDTLAPSTASYVQGELGIKNAIAFDIVAGCTGFVYALSLASSMIKTGLAKNAIVIGAEVFSKILDYEDRASCILFGDGAGAVVIQKQHMDKIIDIHLDATFDEKLSIVVDASRPLDSMEDRNRAPEKPSLHLDGKEVYKFAVPALAGCVKEMLYKHNLTQEDIAYIVPHQANLRIVQAAAKRLGISEDKFYTNMDKYANTSSASIPIALDEMNQKGLLKAGDKILLAGFGAGLTWGSMLIQW